MISIKLLGEVFGKKISEISTSDREARERGYLCINGIFVIFEDNRDIMINIYELADKCKEWAFKQGTSIRTARSFKVDGYLIELFQDYDPMFDTVDLKYSRYNESEIEGIFEACEFILDNKVAF